MTQTEALRLALEALKEITLEHGMTEKARTAIKAALEAKDEETELEKDAVNLLFALHDAWPYVHRHCTIESNKKSIQALIVKHGDFADLHPHPPQQEAKYEPVGLIESLKDAKPCCGQYETCWRACTPRGKFIGHRDAQRKPLTDEEMKKIWYDMNNIMGWYSFQEIARAIEAAHGIKGEA